MNSTDNISDLDKISYALGKRRIYGFIWLFWLFFSITGVYSLSLLRGNELAGKGYVALGVGILGLLKIAWRILEVLSIKEKREIFLEKRESTAKPGKFLRILVWMIPFLGLGALLSPFLFE